MSVLGGSTNDKIEKLNELLKRHEKAVQYLDNMNIAVEEKEKWIPEYRELIREIGTTIDELENTEDKND